MKGKLLSRACKFMSNRNLNQLIIKVILIIRNHGTLQRVLQFTYSLSLSVVLKNLV